jgi:hypothetical protein
MPEFRHVSFVHVSLPTTGLKSSAIAKKFKVSKLPSLQTVKAGSGDALDVKPYSGGEYTVAGIRQFVQQSLGTRKPSHRARDDL